MDGFLKTRFLGSSPGWKLRGWKNLKLPSDPLSGLVGRRHPWRAQGFRCGWETHEKKIPRNWREDISCFKWKRIFSGILNHPMFQEFCKTQKFLWNSCCFMGLWFKSYVLGVWLVAQGQLHLKTVLTRAETSGEQVPCQHVTRWSFWNCLNARDECKLRGGHFEVTQHIDGSHGSCWKKMVGFFESKVQILGCIFRQPLLLICHLWKKLRLKVGERSQCSTMSSVSFPTFFKASKKLTLAGCEGFGWKDTGEQIVRSLCCTGEKKGFSAVQWT